MKFLKNVGMKCKGMAIRTGAKVSKRSPELLMIAGGITFIATVVVACRQTAAKSEEVLDNHERRMSNIDNCLDMALEKESTTEYSLQEAKRDRFLAYCETGLGFARVYAPAIMLGAVSITCFGCSFRIMKKRNLALTTAYAALDQTFKRYRGRVREELGEETDQYFRYGYKKIKDAVVLGKDPATGEDTAVKVDEVDEVPWDEEKANGGLEEGRFVFAPETSRVWGPDELHNDMTLASVRNVGQVNYNMKGYMFLNEILRELGMKEVPYGQLVGWIKGEGDDYLDFGIKKVHRKASTDPNRNPLGLTHECIYELDFNTCGVIWDKI